MHSLRDFLRRPVAWGAVLLSYAGIIAAVAYAANTGATNASGIRAEGKRADAALIAAQKRSNDALVQTGRASIRSSCQFDNRRSVELRRILQRSLDSQRALGKKGAIPRDLVRHNIKITRQDLRDVSFRDCDKAAGVLTAHPKEK